MQSTSLRQTRSGSVGLLLNFLAEPFSRLEPYGMLILLALLFVVPVLGLQMGIDLNIVTHLIREPIEALLRAEQPAFR